MSLEWITTIINDHDDDKARKMLLLKKQIHMTLTAIDNYESKHILSKTQSQQFLDYRRILADKQLPAFTDCVFTNNWDSTCCFKSKVQKDFFLTPVLDDDLVIELEEKLNLINASIVEGNK